MNRKPLYKRNKKAINNKHLNKDRIKIGGFKGTWYVIDERTINDKKYFLLEHNTYGEEVPCVGLGVECGTVFKNINDGLDEIRDRISAGIFF